MKIETVLNRILYTLYKYFLSFDKKVLILY